jgi:hypothetical protein
MREAGPWMWFDVAASQYLRAPETDSPGLRMVRSTALKLGKEDFLRLDAPVKS